MNMKPDCLKHTLKYRLLCISICSIIVPTVILGSLFYWVSTWLITDKVSRTSLDMTIQLKEHIDTIVNDIEETSLYLLQDSQLQLLAERKDIGSDFYLENKQQVEYKLSQLCGAKSYLGSIYIEFLNGDILKSSPSYVVKGSEKKAFAFGMMEKNLLEKQKGKSVWQFRFTDGDRGLLSCSRYLKNLSNQTSGIGYMRLVVSGESLNRLYDRIHGLENSNIYLLDQNNRIVSTNASAKLGEWLSVLEKTDQTIEQTSFQTVMGGQETLVATCFLDSLNWRVVYTVPMEKVLRENELVKRISVLGMVFGAALGILMTVLFSSKIFGRLKALQEVIEQTDGEVLDKRAQVGDDNDEIDSLARSFNQLSDRIEQARKELYDSQIEQQRTELNALQAQMNPHFLYNALDSIYWQCSMEHAPEASQLVLALSKLFRMTLSYGDNTCTLKEELDFVRSYLKIMYSSKGEKISFAFSVDHGLENRKVLKMLLQPLCENVFQHAFTIKQEGTVMIRIFQDGENLIYRMQDNGDGVDELYIEYLIQKGTEKKGLALRNIKHRLELTYGKQAYFKFHSEPGVGTTIEISQPIS